MKKRVELLAEKQMHLAEMRTDMAYERTIIAYLRTAAPIILFGIAFLGLSKARWDFLFYAGIISVATGIFFVAIAARRAVRHFKELKRIKNFFVKFIHLKKK